jgi:hypothetical protein
VNCVIWVMTPIEPGFSINLTVAYSGERQIYRYLAHTEGR